MFNININTALVLVLASTALALPQPEYASSKTCTKELKSSSTIATYGYPSSNSSVVGYSENVAYPTSTEASSAGPAYITFSSSTSTSATSTTSISSTPVTLVLTPSVIALQEGLTDSAHAFMVTDDGATNSSFLFDSASYNALQAYLTQTLKLPANNGEFEALYDKASFNTEMATVDAQFGDLYAMVESAIVGVYTHSNDFQTSTVSQIAVLADGLSKYATLAANSYLGMVTTLSVMNGHDSGSPQFANGLDSLNNTMYTLINQLQPLAVSCADIETKIVGFQGVITQDQDTINKVSTTFASAAPAMNDVVTNLNSNIDQLNTQINNDNNNIQGWQNDISDGAKHYAWLFPIGTIIWASKKSGYDAQIDGAVNDRNAAMATLAADNNEKAVVASVMNIAGDMTRQMSGVATEIAGAQVMMSKATVSFSMMLASINDIVTQLQTADDFVNMPHWFTTDLFISELGTAASDWSSIQGPAQAFAAIAAANNNAAGIIAAQPATMEIAQTCGGFTLNPGILAALHVASTAQLGFFHQC